MGVQGTVIRFLAKVKRYLSFRKRPGWPTQLHIQWEPATVPARLSGWGVKLTIRSHIAKTLRMKVKTLPLPHTASWPTQNKFHQRSILTRSAIREII